MAKLDELAAFLDKGDEQSLAHLRKAAHGLASQVTDKLKWTESCVDGFHAWPEVEQHYQIILDGKVCHSGTRFFGIEDGLSGWHAFRLDEGDDHYEELLEFLELLPDPDVPEPISIEEGNLEKSIAGLRKAAVAYPPDRDPEGWLATQYLLAAIMKCQALIILQGARTTLAEVVELDQLGSAKPAIEQLGQLASDLENIRMPLMLECSE